MENFNQFKNYESINEYNLDNNNFEDISIQEENERKFDILLDGLLKF